MSAYVQKCLCKNLDVAMSFIETGLEDGLLRAEHLKALQQQDIYRGFYLMNSIDITPYAILFLDTFVKGLDHKAVKKILGQRFMKECEESIPSTRGDDCDLNFKVTLKDLILKAQKQEHTILQLNEAEVEKVKLMHEKMIGSLYNIKHEPLTHNTSLLLNEAWKVASKVTSAMESKGMTKREDSLLLAFHDQEFLKRFYRVKDKLLLWTPVVEVLKWVTAAESVDEHRSALKNLGSSHGKAGKQPRSIDLCADESSNSRGPR